ncbi:MAG: hypothetical protein K1X72_05260 [Pyrinomonadaceae bacterium]|nr:hypothetical protein [Pyrinomonadaceae bacterium]
MINHISIAVNETEKVANFLAEIWNGAVYPFPPAPGKSFIVVANDGRGSAVEVTPIDTILIPGEGYPAEEGFNSDVRTEEFEAKFMKSDFVPQYVPTHLNINTQLNEEEVKELARREGWRVLTCNRGEGLFQLVEVWIENRFMLEVMTPEQTARYIEITSPEFMQQAFNPAAYPQNENVSTNLNLVG